MSLLTRRLCGRRDLNPHALRRHPLKMVRLPVSPLPRTEGRANIIGAEILPHAEDVQDGNLDPLLGA